MAYVALQGTASDLARGVLSDVERTLRSSISRVTLKSRLMKDVVMNQPLAKGDPGTAKPPAGPGVREKVMQFVQPAVIVDSVGGQVVWAPYGLPSKEYGQTVMLVGAGFAFLAAYGAYHLLFGKK